MDFFVGKRIGAEIIGTYELIVLGHLKTLKNDNSWPFNLHFVWSLISYVRINSNKDCKQSWNGIVLQ